MRRVIERTIFNDGAGNDSEDSVLSGQVIFHQGQSLVQQKGLVRGLCSKIAFGCCHPALMELEPAGLVTVIGRRRTAAPRWHFGPETHYNTTSRPKSVVEEAEEPKHGISVSNIMQIP